MPTNRPSRWRTAGSSSATASSRRCASGTGSSIEFDLHLRRLRDGLAVLAIPLPPSDPEIADAVRTVVDANGLADAAVRLTVSRGTPAGRGTPPGRLARPRPTIVIQAWPHHGAPASLATEGLRLDHLRPAPRRRPPARPGQDDLARRPRARQARGHRGRRRRRARPHARRASSPRRRPRTSRP